MVTIVHPFTSAKADGLDTTLVQPSNWNAAHTITLAATDKILGRVSSGGGAAEEVTFTDQAQQLSDDTSFSAMRTTLGLAIGTDVQAYHAILAALAGLTIAADKLPYGNGSNTFAVADFTAAARTFVALSTVALMRANLLAEQIGTITGVDNKTSGYTFALTDIGKAIEAEHATNAIELTVPANATVAFPTTSWVTGVRAGAGVVTIKGAVGVTINGVSAGTITIPVRYGAVTLYKRGTDDWIAPNFTAV